jgi:hypothetical protein
MIRDYRQNIAFDDKNGILNKWVNLIINLEAHFLSDYWNLRNGIYVISVVYSFPPQRFTLPTFNRLMLN